MSASLKHYGMTSDIVKQAFALEGVKVIYRFRPWTRAYEEAKQGVAAQATPLWTKTPERMHDFLYSDVILTLPEVFFVRKGEQIKWTNMQDLGAYKIGAMLGYRYGFESLEHKGKIVIERISSLEDNFKKLLSHRVDAVIEELDVGLFTLKKMGISGKVVASPKAFSSKDYSLIVGKKAKDAKEIIRIFNQGLLKLKQSGRFQKILDASRNGAYIQ